MRLLRSALAFLIAAASAAQAPRPTALLETADAAFNAHDWQQAATAYGELAKTTPDVRTCYRLGYCLHTLGKLDEAMPWHRRAAAMVDQDKRLAATAAYNVACVHALQGRKDEALAALGHCIDLGFANSGHMRRDEDLASLHGDQKFEAIVSGLETALAAKVRLVAVVVYEGVEMLDFAGPVEVFESARGPGGERLFRVVLVAPLEAPVHAGRMTATITPDHGIDDCPQPAILVIPGGATEVLEQDAAFIAWVGRVQPKTTVTLSVCTGAFVLAKLGLLDGKEATTHHSSLDGLSRQYPRVRTRSDVKYVDSGACVTAAGVSSGIEGSLHVVERLCGAEVAAGVARNIEYPWRPEPAPAATSK